MEFKQDVGKTLARFEAWWQCEMVDRAPVTIYVENYPKVSIPNKSGQDLRQAWTDVEAIIDQFENNLKSCIFIGDTVPVFLPNLGPDLCATVYGGDLEFSRTTTWYKPTLSSSRQLLDIVPDFDSFYWQTVRQMTDVSLSRGHDKWLTAIPDLHTNADLLAALRGPEQLCLEIMDDPDGVKEALGYVQSHFDIMYQDFAQRLATARQPVTTWTPFLSSVTAYPVSCDFIGLISPTMFEQAVLPFIEYEIDYVDRSLFHLDGPGALKHLDRLLEIPRLNGIQWVYGAGQEPAAKWIEVYKKIQAAGKAIQLGCESPADALTVMEHLKPEGVWIYVKGLYSRHEADALIQQVEKWSKNNV